MRSTHWFLSGEKLEQAIVGALHFCAPICSQHCIVLELEASEHSHHDISMSRHIAGFMVFSFYIMTSSCSINSILMTRL